MLLTSLIGAFIKTMIGKINSIPWSNEVKQLHFPISFSLMHQLDFQFSMVEINLKPTFFQLILNFIKLFRRTSVLVCKMKMVAVDVETNVALPIILIKIQ